MSEPFKGEVQKAMEKAVADVQAAGAIGAVVTALVVEGNEVKIFAQTAMPIPPAATASKDAIDLMGRLYNETIDQTSRAIKDIFDKNVQQFMLAREAFLTGEKETPVEGVPEALAAPAEEATAEEKADE